MKQVMWFILTRVAFKNVYENDRKIVINNAQQLVVKACFYCETDYSGIGAVLKGEIVYKNQFVLWILNS